MARKLNTVAAPPPLVAQQDAAGVRIWDARIPPAWIKVTSTTAQTVTLYNGNTLSGYAAVIETWLGTADGTNITWNDNTGSVWFVGVNGEVPTLDARYECRLLGVDSGGVAVWATEAIRTEIVILNSSTPNGDGLYDASIQRYDATSQTWTTVQNIWLRNANA